MPQSCHLKLDIWAFFKTADQDRFTLLNGWLFLLGKTSTSLRALFILWLTRQLVFHHFPK